MSTLDKENWLREHGTLVMNKIIHTEGYYGDWDYGYASHSYRGDTREDVINVLYKGAQDELFSWCLHHEEGL